MTNEIEVYLEIGKKRTFAGAVKWPGWCRSAREEGSALQALLDYAPRYARVLHAASLEFQAPASAGGFSVIERLVGTPTTDFGAPDVSPSSDEEPLGEAELHRLQALLSACWQAFDQIAGSAAGVVLRKGPRGGGRDVEDIVMHVREAEASYLGRIGGKLSREKGENAGQTLEQDRQEILAALARSARGEMPLLGPRGGKLWTPRYFVLRAAWHVLDHAWEIEDRRG
jgi:hypothetical protein